MEERNERGQFVKGHSGGPGRPRKHTEEEYTNATVSAVSPTEWKTIMVALKKKAMRGDIRAAKLLADYLLGLPIQRMDMTSAGQPLALPIEFNYGAAIAGIATRPDADSDAPSEN